MNYYKDENDKVYAFNDLQVKRGLANNHTPITESEATELTTVTLTDEELAKAGAEKAQSHLDSTDWIVAKYLEVVVLNKEMTDEEYQAKYADVYTARSEARTTVSDYEDTYLTDE